MTAQILQFRDYEPKKRRTDADRLADLDRKEANGPVNYCQFGDGEINAIKADGSIETIEFECTCSICGESKQHETIEFAKSGGPPKETA